MRRVKTEAEHEDPYCPARGCAGGDSRLRSATGTAGNPYVCHGFIARIQPGTRFVLEQMPVAGGLWLPQHYSMQARAKVLFLFSYNSQEESTYFGYHKRGAAPVHMALGKQIHE
jgi:hypothetical protein